MAAAIKAKHQGATVALTRGSGGVFDVAVDGQRVFSKREAGRFPRNDEILGMIEGKG
ncbi:MAG: Rdx family protein [Gemmataceae bacterium]|nr:Rdx family protein [Gemmataceae bacterium]